MRVGGGRVKAVLLALALLAVGVAAAPVASAEPCEVPGCNVAGAALCLLVNAKHVAKSLDECLTQPA